LVQAALQRVELFATGAHPQLCLPAMACQGMLSIAALLLAAAARAPPAAPAAAVRRLQQSGQPSYCDGITRTDLNQRRWANGLNSGGSLEFYDVARLSDNTPVRLAVTNSTPYYRPVAGSGNSPATGLRGQNIGQIGLRLDPELQPGGQCFNFRYENGNTGQGVDLGDSILTFLDADNVNDGCREVYRICDRDVEFLTTQDSTLTRTTSGVEGTGDCTEFSSSRTNVNDPTNSQSLTSSQANSGFGVRFSNSVDVCMRLEGTDCNAVDRQLMFGGLSTIDNCPLRESGASTGGASASNAPAACSSTCTFAGRTATCGELFREVRQNGVGGSSNSMSAASVRCANAWAVVVDACNACSGCSMSHVCQGLFELGPTGLPQTASGSGGLATTVAGLSAGLGALAAALALGRVRRPAPTASAAGAAEAGPKQPLVELSS